MLTTQVQFLFYIGSFELASCSVFVPIPNIIIKSHQTLEAILPHLPISLLTAAPAASDPNDQDHQLLTALESPTEPSSPCSQALVGSPSSLVLRSRNDSGILTTHHNCSSGSSASASASANGSGHQSSNRISPESSIPATTCIKIALQPTPSFKFVKPECPHIQQKQKNQRHYRQQQRQQQQKQEQQPQQQPQPQPAPYPHSHSRSHSRSQSHCRHRSHSHQSNSPPLRRTSTMASLEYRLTSSPETVTVTFTYPIPSNSASSSTFIPKVVQVAGNFNAWQRTEPLRKNEEASRFEGEVSIVLDSIQDQENSTRKKILFKFVLDGSNWVTDPDQEVDQDYAGNLNNVIFLNTRSSRTSSSRTSSSSTLVQTPEYVAVATTPTTAKVEELDEERHGRIKQEEEEEEDIIRDLGGGTLGAPVFDINNPVDLPEHFTISPEQNEAKPAVRAAPTEAVAIDTHAVSAPEQHEDAKAEPSIKEFAPDFQINDSAASNLDAKTEVSNATIPVSIHDRCSTFGDIQESVTQIIEIVKNAERKPAVGDARLVVDESVDPLPSLTNSRTNSALTAIDSSSVSSEVRLDETGVVGFESGKDDGESSVVLLPSHPGSPLVPQTQRLTDDAKPTADFSAATLTIAIPDKMSMLSMTAPNTPVTTAPPAKKRRSMSSATVSILTNGRGSPSRSSSSTAVSRKSIWKRVKEALS